MLILVIFLRGPKHLLGEAGNCMEKEKILMLRRRVGSCMECIVSHVGLQNVVTVIKKMITEANEEEDELRAQHDNAKSQLDTSNTLLSKVRMAVVNMTQKISTIEGKVNKQYLDATAAEADAKVLTTNISSAEVRLNSLIADLRGPNQQMRETVKTGVIVSFLYCFSFVVGLSGFHIVSVDHY